MGRSLAILIAAASALVVAGLVVGILAVRQPEATFPQGTPEATVAQYLRLRQSGNVEEAYALTSMQFANRPMDLAAFRSQNSHWGQTAHRVTMASSKTTGDQATVAVDVATFEPDFLGGDSTARETFNLVRQSGSWRITSPTGLY
ncbi:MAG: hypothetical protein JOZ39_13430 [Chloroflexi bacterium]|nr:hypothetical protein [Chloroflexota bacterium]